MISLRSKRISKKSYRKELIEIGFIIFVILLVPSCSTTVVDTNQFSTTTDPATVTGTTAQIELNQDNDQIVSTPSPLSKRGITPDPSQIQPETNQHMPISSLPDPGGFEWQLITGGLLKPVTFIQITDQTGRYLVVEQPGQVRVLENGFILPEPFLDIQDRVGSEGSEQGLLDLELDPNFTENGFFFINYTDQAGDTRISRFQVTDPFSYEADPNSEEIILEIPQPYGNHNGGDIDFGPDGFLYIATGDGGSAGDPLGNAQSLDTLLGKILRIDVQGVFPYSIPVDNPFKSGNGRPEIWAYGLRNPWRFSFDSLTSDIYIADVGQNQWEEINFLEESKPAGVNFGWNYYEGNHEYSGVQPSGIELELPVAEYDHGSGCSVTGGEVYRGNQLPEFYGVYFYGDYCSGNVWGMFKDEAGTWQSELLFENIAQVSSFDLDDSGELYLVDHSGRILKLVRKVN
jgi:glucose/arabinose dehydrogenase